MVGNQVPADLRHRLVTLEASVDARYALHRGLVRGVELNDNEIIEVLKTSNDVDERREAWEAAKTVGAAVADDVRELARMRNEIARTLGYRDWFAFALERPGDGRGQALRDACLMRDRDRSRRSPVGSRRWMRDSRSDSIASREELRPWHYADPFFQDVPTEGGVELDSLLAERDVVALAGETFSGLRARYRPGARPERSLRA